MKEFVYALSFTIIAAVYVHIVNVQYLYIYDSCTFEY